MYQSLCLNLTNKHYKILKGTSFQIFEVQNKLNL